MGTGYAMSTVPEVDLAKIQRDRGKAPNLRRGMSGETCAQCVHFGLLPSLAWRGDGMCYLYDVPTHEKFVCDSFLGEDELPDGDGQRVRAPAKRNSRPRKVVPDNPFREFNARAVQAPRSGSSTTDLLASLKAE